MAKSTQRSAAAEAPSCLIRVRDQSRDTAPLEIHGDDARETLVRALGAEVTAFEFPVMYFEDARICALDADTHHWDHRPDGALLEATAKAVVPRPDCWWRTHGNGLRLIYVDPTAGEADARAALGAISLPVDFRVELKRDTRHPRGRHPDRVGASAGTPEWLSPTTISAPAARRQRVDRVAAEQWLMERGLAIGGRYAHSTCPIEPHHPSEGKPVAVYADAIHCFSCAGRSVSKSERLPPGHVPFGALLGVANGLTTLGDMAGEFVHWSHARQVLAARHPNLSESILETAYRSALLSSAWDANDPRLGRAFNRDLLVVRSHGLWLHAQELTPISLSKDTFAAFPWCYFAVEADPVEPGSGDEGDGEDCAPEEDAPGARTAEASAETHPLEPNPPESAKAAVDPENTETPEEPGCKLVLSSPRFDLARSGARLAGYVPIRPVRGVILRPEIIDDTEVVVVVPPPRGAPVRILRGSELLPEAEACELVSQAFPGISLNYLRGLIGGAACAEAGGRPVIQMAVGPTGSGKGETPRIAASFLGDVVLKVLIDAESAEKFRREVGSAVASGRRFLLVDEVGKVRRLGTYVRYLLELSSEITWRALFTTSDVVTPVRSSFVLANLSVPEVLATAPEVCRRLRLVRLLRQVPDWAQTCGGDSGDWRSRSAANARVANSIVTHALAFAARHGFVWERVADALDYGRPDEGDSHSDDEALVLLYRHARGEYGRRVLATSGRFARGDWVDAKGIQPTLDRLTTGDMEAVYHLRNRLESIAWNDLLRIEDPPIVCQLRDHGQQIVFRFLAHEPAMRGRERRNERLPRDRWGDRASAPPSAFPLALNLRPTPETTGVPAGNEEKGSDFVSDVVADEVRIATDGSCYPNPGPGGYAAVIDLPGRRVELQGGDAQTTNNRMELMGAIAALEHLSASMTVRVFTDSQYVCEGARSTNGLREIAANRDLWIRLKNAERKHFSVSWEWVRGHAGHAGNERADTLAGEARVRIASGGSGELSVREGAAQAPPTSEQDGVASVDDGGDLFAFLRSSASAARPLVAEQGDAPEGPAP